MATVPFPVNDQDGKTAPAPLTEKQRMAPVNIGKPMPAEQRKQVPMNDKDGKTAPPPKKYAKGGMTRADGCCKKGHTKGRMV